MHIRWWVSVLLSLLVTSVSHAEWKVARFPRAAGDTSPVKCILKGYSQSGDSADLNVRELALLLRRSPEAAKIVESAYGVPDAKLFLLEQALTGGEVDKCQPDFLLPIVPANHSSCAQLAKLLNEKEVPSNGANFFSNSILEN